MAGNKDQKPFLDKPDEEEQWGSLHCADCEKAVCHFPPDSPITEEMDLEVYCDECKKKVTD